MTNLLHVGFYGTLIKTAGQKNLMNRAGQNYLLIKKADQNNGLLNWPVKVHVSVMKKGPVKMSVSQCGLSSVRLCGLS
jgi:hypothetical protein